MDNVYYLPSGFYSETSIDAGEEPCEQRLAGDAYAEPVQERLLIEQERRAQVRAAWSGLTTLERRVFAAAHGLDGAERMGCRLVGRRVGLSHEKARRVEIATKTKLRAALADLR